jgi:hypothetical protein
VTKILFVLNKVDYARIEERTRLADFLRDVLVRNVLWSSDSLIFNVSARDGLDAKQRGDSTELASSGLAGISKTIYGDIWRMRRREPWLKPWQVSL